jgi:hypothetical protein
MSSDLPSENSKCKLAIQQLLSENFALDSKKKFRNLIVMDKDKASVTDLIGFVSEDENLNSNMSFYIKTAIKYKHLQLVIELINIDETIFDTNLETYAELFVTKFKKDSQKDSQKDIVLKIFLERFAKILPNQTVLNAILMSGSVHIAEHLLQNNICSHNDFLHSVNGTLDTVKSAQKLVIKTIILKSDLLINLFIGSLDQISVSGLIILAVWTCSKASVLGQVLEFCEQTFSENDMDTLIMELCSVSISFEDCEFLAVWLKTASEDKIVRLLSQCIRKMRFKSKVYENIYKILGQNFPLTTATSDIVLELCLSRTSSINQTDCRYFIDRGLNSGIITPESLTPFVANASQSQNIDFDTFVYLVNNCNSLDDILFRQISGAVCGNPIDRFKYLLEQGANPNQRNGFLMFISLFELSVPTLKLLIDYGGNIDLVRTAIDEIDLTDKEDIIRYFNLNCIRCNLPSHNLSTVRELCHKYIDKLIVTDFNLPDTFFTDFQEENQHSVRVDFSYTENITFAMFLEHVVAQTYFHDEMLRDPAFEYAVSIEDCFEDCDEWELRMDSRLENLVNGLTNSITNNYVDLKAFAEAFKYVNNLTDTTELTTVYKSFELYVKNCVENKCGAIFYCIFCLFVNSDEAIQLIRETLEQLQPTECQDFFLEFVKIFMGGDHILNKAYVKETMLELIDEIQTAKN